MPILILHQLDEDYSISHLPMDAQNPTWWDGGGFASISRSAAGVSVVCRSDRVPVGVITDRGWTAFILDANSTVREKGTILSVVRPLSENGLDVFFISTFNGECLLLKTEHVPRGKRYLQAAGHRFTKTN